MTAWKTKELKSFADAAQSLKLYRRAELLDTNDRPLIEQLYVDPLPSNATLDAMVRPNTTFVVGRKGTGKSTVFQRAQHEIRKQKNAVSAYVDIKTVYESATVDPTLLQRASNLATALSEDQLRKLLLYKSFLRTVLSEIRKELKTQIDNSFIEKLKERFGAGRNEVFDALDSILNRAFENEFSDVTGLETMSGKQNSGRKTGISQRSGISFGSKVGSEAATVDASLRAEGTLTQSEDLQNEQSFSRVLLRNLNITGVMEEIQELLETIEIRHLYIFVDDFS